MAGLPFMRTHGSDGTTVDFEAGIPIAKPIEEKGRVKNGELPGGRTLTAWHVGPYEQLTDAHQRLKEWATTKGMAARGGPWEVYWTDPGMVPDPSKWRTQIFLPIEAAPDGR
jgi:effector-binding domain-containing protein